MTQQPSSTSSDALTGAGVGATAGLLSTLFKKDRKLKDFVKRTLVGGGVGAVAGVGLGGLRRDEPSAPPSTSEPSKPRLSPRSAALAGILPGIGPAIYGATQSADGDRTANALKLGLSSLAGGLPGGHMAQVAAQRGQPGVALLANLLAMAGSAGLSGTVAKHINKSAFDMGAIGSRIQQGASSLKDRLGNVETRPYDPMYSGALGGIVGGAAGGLGGILKAIFDKEDDGIFGTLGKALSGAAIGGFGGAALGGGYSMLQRQRLLNQTPEKQHGAIREIMRGYKTPAKAEMSKLFGGGNNYAPEISRLNRRAAVSHAVSPHLVNALERRSQMS